MDWRCADSRDGCRCVICGGVVGCAVGFCIETFVEVGEYVCYPAPVVFKLPVCGCHRCDQLGLLAAFDPSYSFDVFVILYDVVDFRASRRLSGGMSACPSV